MRFVRSDRAKLLSYYSSVVKVAVMKREFVRKKLFLVLCKISFLNFIFCLKKIGLSQTKTSFDLLIDQHIVLINFQYENKKNLKAFLIFLPRTQFIDKKEIEV